MEFFSIYNKKILQSEEFWCLLPVQRYKELLQFLKPVSSDQHLYGKQKQRPRQCKVMQVGGVGNLE